VAVRTPTLSAEAVEIGAVLGGRLARFAPTGGHRHDLFAGRTSCGELFVKLFPPASASAARERAAAHLISEHLTDLVPAMVADGVTRSGRPWMAYEWIEMRRFAPDTANLHAAGRALARLHRLELVSRPDALPRYGNPVNLVEHKARLVERYDAMLAAHIRELCRRLKPTVAPSAALYPQVLLHGDFGWRNVLLNPDGAVVLVDFEHAALGAPVLELAKLWDRELRGDVERATFLDGYQSERPIDREAWMVWLPLVRLWASAGIVPYARQTGDEEFEQHALDIIARLEREATQ
jgi:Ser/Thr protein kinase RdoA (MazF antagonist)